MGKGSLDGAVMTARPSIVEFLRARLDEDERVTRGEITRREVWQSKLDQMRRVGEMVGVGLIDYDEPGAPGDPARVLAEVAFKRAVLLWCERSLVDNDGQPWPDEWMLLSMASLYADHEDYDPAWAAP